jgi:putative SOS response-associated peptidase YedK
MCNRYWVRGDKPEVTKVLPDLDFRVDYGVRYNVAPGHSAPIIRRAGVGSLTLDNLAWGIPEKTVVDPTAGPTVSLKHHEAATRIGHRTAYLYRRCLIPTNGFFIWQQATPTCRVPWLLSYPGESLMMLAGLWEPHSEIGDTFAILTGPPPNRAIWVGYQFPVLLPPCAWRSWLDPDCPFSELAARVHSGVHRPNRDLQQWRVTSRVESPEFQDPAAVMPIPARQELG